MALTSGFFNAVLKDGEYDRVYNSDQFNDYFRGIVAQNGIFANVGDMFSVTPAEGMKLNVNSGKALIDGHWVKLTSLETVTINDPTGVGYARRDLIVLHIDENTASREVTLVVKQGDSILAKPVKEPIGNYTDDDGNQVFEPVDGVLEIPLAIVTVGPNATELDDGDIVTTVGTVQCPYISHLVYKPEDFDPDSFFATYYTNFQKWYAKLTDEAKIDTSLKAYHQTIVGGSDVGSTIQFDLTSVDGDGTHYTYDPSDVLNVYYNGLFLSPAEYAITYNTQGGVISFDGSMTEGNVLYIRGLKSIVGTPTYADGNGVSY